MGSVVKLLGNEQGPLSIRDVSGSLRWMAAQIDSGAMGEVKIAMVILDTTGSAIPNIMMTGEDCTYAHALGMLELVRVRVTPKED
jgi:hypothetical protein